MFSCVSVHLFKQKFEFSNTSCNNMCKEHLLLLFPWGACMLSSQVSLRFHGTHPLNLPLLSPTVDLYKHYFQVKFKFFSSLLSAT